MAQSLARLWTHLIFSTKNRFPFLIDQTLRTEMHAYLAKMLREQDCETVIVNGVEDHIHALFALSRTHSIASVVKEIKRTSSGFAKELAQQLAKFHWQNGYGAFSVSQSNLQEVILYIENQEEHHKRVSFQDEYRAFLKAYGGLNTMSATFGTKSKGEGNSRDCFVPRRSQLLQSWRRTSGNTTEPRVAKAQPWAGVSERFQR